MNIYYECKCKKIQTKKSTVEILATFFWLPKGKFFISSRSKLEKISQNEQKFRFQNEILLTRSNLPQLKQNYNKKKGENNTKRPITFNSRAR